MLLLITSSPSADQTNTEAERRSSTPASNDGELHKQISLRRMFDSLPIEMSLWHQSQAMFSGGNQVENDSLPCIDGHLLQQSSHTDYLPDCHIWRRSPEIDGSVW
jgi:hypothetical protein